MDRIQYRKAAAVDGIILEAMSGVEYRHVSKYCVDTWHEYLISYHVNGEEFEQVAYSTKSLNSGDIIRVRYVINAGYPEIMKYQYAVEPGPIYVSIKWVFIFIVLIVVGLILGYIEGEWSF